MRPDNKTLREDSVAVNANASFLCILYNHSPCSLFLPSCCLFPLHLFIFFPVYTSFIAQLCLRMQPHGALLLAFFSSFFLDNYWEAESLCWFFLQHSFANNSVEPAKGHWNVTGVRAGKRWLCLQEHAKFSHAIGFVDLKMQSIFDVKLLLEVWVVVVVVLWFAWRCCKYYLVSVFHLSELIGPISTNTNVPAAALLQNELFPLHISNYNIKLVFFVTVLKIDQLNCFAITSRSYLFWRPFHLER